VTPLTWQFL